MPKVTDFPDNRASMLQAVFQSRQADLQADQMYLQSNAQTQQLRQSLFGMMLQDKQHGESINFGDRQLAEGGRQFDAQLGHQENVLAQDQSQFESSMTQDQNQFDSNLTHMKNVLQLGKDQFQYTKDQDQQAAQLGFLNSVEESINEMMQVRSQLNALNQQRDRAGFLLGEDRIKYNNLVEQYKDMGLTSRIALNERASVLGIDPGMSSMLDASMQYISNSEFDIEEVSSENVLGSDYTAATQQSAEKRGWGRFINFGLIEPMSRLFRANESNAYSPKLKDAANNLVSILSDPTKTWDQKIERDWNAALDVYYHAGSHRMTRGSDRSVDENLNRNSEAMQSIYNMFQNGYLQSMANELGVSFESVDTPMNREKAYEVTTPSYIRNADTAISTLSDYVDGAQQIALQRGLRQGENFADLLEETGMATRIASTIKKIDQDHKTADLRFRDGKQKEEYFRLRRAASSFGISISTIDEEKGDWWNPFN